MAKKCSTCKRSYPDHLSACPHCHPAKAGPAAKPFDEPTEFGEDVHLAETQRPAAKKPADDEILEIAAEAEVTEGASDVLNVEEAEVVESPSSKSGVLVVDEVDAVQESPSAKSDVLDLDESTIVADPASSKSDVIDVSEAEVVAEPASAKSDVLEIAEAEAVVEPGAPKSDVLDIDAAQVLLGPPSGKAEAVSVGEAPPATEAASAKSDVLEIAEADAGAEPDAPKSDVLDLDAAQFLMEGSSGKSDVVPLDEVSGVEGPVSAKSDVLEVAEVDAVTEPVSAKSDVLDLNAADVVVEPSSVKSDILEIAEADAIVETPSGKEAAIEIVDEAEPKKAREPPPSPAKPDPKATRIAGKTPAPTMLAPDDLDEGPGSELRGLLGAPAPSPAFPREEPPKKTEEPPKKLDPKATRIAGKAPAPTMLAPDDALDEGPGSELRGAGVPASMPKMELDSSKHDKSEEIVDFAAEDVVEEVSEEDLVDAADALESGVDLEQTLALEPPGGESSKSSAIDILDGGSEVDIDLSHKGGAKGTSGVDMIAEALESGVNLAGDSAKSEPPAKQPRGRRKSEVDLEGVFDEVPESSAVDLGAESPARGKKRTAADDEVADVEEVVDDDALVVPESSGEGSAEEALLAEGYALKKKQAEEEAAAIFGEEGAEVTDDVSGELPQVKHKKGTKASDGDMVLDDEGAVVEEAVEEAVDDDLVVPKAKDKGKTKGKFKGDDEELFPEEDGKRGRREKPERVRGGGRVLIGMGLGILLTAGVGVVIWYLAPDLLSSIPESPRGEGWKWQKTPPKADVKKQTQAKHLLVARGFMDKGEFENAIKELDNEESTEGQVMRGDARWQKYVQEQRAADKPLQKDDPGAKEAITDFDKAENKYFPPQIDKAIQADAQARAALATDKIVRDALTKAELLKPAEKDVGKIISDVIAKKLDYDDLIAKMTKALVENKQWKDGDPLKAAPFKDVVENLADAKAKLDESSKTLKVAPREVPKTVADLVAERRDLDGRLGEVNAKLKAAGVKGTDDKGVKELADARDTLLTQKDALDAAVAQALAQLKQSGIPLVGNDPKKQLVEGSKTIRLKAESPLASSLGSMFSSLSQLGSGGAQLLQRGLDSTATSAQLALAKAREALNDTPEQRLDTQIALLHDRARKDPRAVATASKYLEWVNSKGATASPETKAKALYALGLSQRNVEQFKDAVQSLKQAVDAAAALKTPPAWLASARNSYKELTDAAAYYLPQAQRLERAGKLPQALEELSTGLKALPGDPRLLAERGLVRLDMAQPPAKLDNGTAQQVRDDAVLVQKDPRYAAAGYYLLGRLAEQTGKLAQAEENYTKAVELNKGSQEDAERYRSALGNLLLRDRPAGDAEAAPKGKAAAETSRLEAPAPATAPQLRPATARLLVVLLVTGVQPPLDEDENPEQAARLKKATKVAEDLIKSDNPRSKGEGYMILGQVYAKQGKRTDGLFTYIKGLELYYPGKKLEELVKMVNEHPAFQQPDTLAKSDQRQAERHFGKGLDYYWAGQYAAAEKQFGQAFANFDQDARYLYYLGLARYSQQTKAKREAAVQAWRDGVRLEAANRPHSIYVNASLERLQGDLRQLLGSYRQKTP